MKSAAEYRFEARSALQNNLGWAILVVLVVSAITQALGSVSGGIATLIFSGALSVGMSLAFIGLFRKRKIEFTDLFSAFSNNFLNALVMGLLSYLFIFLWSLLFIIPGIIAAYSYSMAPYILADNPGMDGQKALEVSKKLMDGKKSDLFLLHLSFIGWILLSALTFGVLYIVYVAPYMQAATTAFYESVKHEVPAYGFTGPYTDTEKGPESL